MRRIVTLVLVVGCMVVGGVIVARRASLTDFVRGQVYKVEQYVDRARFEGRPSPALEGVSLSALKGRPVLLFFWAHWCPACKRQVASVAAVEKRFASRGLAVIGLTRLYGYVHEGTPATPETERLYIEQVRRQYYGALGDIPHANSAANWEMYRTNTTPTIVLLDKDGIVRFYNPGFLTESELSERVEMLF